MIESMVAFPLALGLILFAQIGEVRREVRMVVYWLLLALGTLIILAGVVVMVAPHTLNLAESLLDSTQLGWTLLIAGGLIVLPTFAGTRFDRRSPSPRLAGIPWTHPVHLTAWALLVMFIGSNVALTSLESLSEIEITHPLTIIITQNITFVLAALLGVGWGVRRNWQGVTRRLGLSRPRGRDVWLGATMALLMLMSTMLVGALVTIMFGDGLAESTGFNQQIIQQLPGVGGVLLMGFASGIGEELLYRGALQPVARLWLTSLLFALSHIQYLSPAIAIIFVLGLLLGAIRDRWGLNTAIWAHAVYNTLVGLFALLAMNFDQLTFGM